MNQMLFWVGESVDPLSNRSLLPFLSRFGGWMWRSTWEVSLGAMEEREKSSGSVFCEMNVGEDDWWSVTVGKGQNGYLYPSGPNGTLSAALPHSRCGTAAPTKITLLDVKFCWLFWLSMRMWFSGFEHLVQQLDSCSCIPLYSMAFFLNSIFKI